MKYRAVLRHSVAGTCDPWWHGRWRDDAEVARLQAARWVQLPGTVEFVGVECSDGEQRPLGTVAP